MKLGLLTDIHAHVYYLQAALEQLKAEHVHELVVLGDVVDTFGHFEGVEETCRLLQQANAVGVWGNHDYGLCVDPDAAARAKYPPTVLEFMATLRPRLEIDGCYFSHVEPWLDPEYMPDLWYVGGRPDTLDRLARIFSAVPHRLIFNGHFHHWFAATTEGVRNWEGTTPLRFAQGRHFTIVGALCEGDFATFDTVTSQLVPLKV